MKPLPQPDFTRPDPDELRATYRATMRDLTSLYDALEQHRAEYQENQIVSPEIMIEMERLEDAIMQIRRTAHFWSIDLSEPEADPPAPPDLLDQTLHETLQAQRRDLRAAVEGDDANAE